MTPRHSLNKKTMIDCSCSPPTRALTHLRTKGEKERERQPSPLHERDRKRVRCSVAAPSPWRSPSWRSSVSAPTQTSALYTEGGDVVLLRADTFEEMVIKDDAYWMVGTPPGAVTASSSRPSTRRLPRI